MAAYYNEHDPKAAAWLRELIRRNLINVGEVDERSIEVVQPADLRGFTQCHFFAGIGVWSYALRNAGWPDDRPVWTGSCPCQPFSAAGKGEGGNDPRHLWPSWFRLARELRPDVVFGEQVESAIRHGWLDLVSADLEAEGYAIGSVVLGAHSVGAPHIRQRCYFVAESEGVRRAQRGVRDRESASGPPEGNHAERRPALVGHAGVAGDSRNGALDHPTDTRRQGTREHDGGLSPFAARLVEPITLGELGQSESERRREARREHHGRPAERPCLSGDACDMGNTSGAGLSEQRREPGAPRRSPVAVSRQAFERASTPVGGFWSDAEWLECSDGKTRPVEPGTFPLAHGAPARVVRLRGYGNAIVAEVATTFIEAYLDVRGGVT